MFGNKKYKIRPINEVFDLQLGKTPSRTEPKYWCTNNHKWVSVADRADMIDSHRVHQNI